MISLTTLAMLQVRLLWEMVSYNSESDGWQFGMVPVRANSVEDIVQNFIPHDNDNESDSSDDDSETIEDATNT